MINPTGNTEVDEVTVKLNSTYCTPVQSSSAQRTARSLASWLLFGVLMLSSENWGKCLPVTWLHLLLYMMNSAAITFRLLPHTLPHLGFYRICQTTKTKQTQLPTQLRVSWLIPFTWEFPRKIICQQQLYYYSENECLISFENLYPLHFLE